MRQIGLVGSASQGGAAHAEMRASGAWAAGYAVDASASLGGAALAWRGRYAPTAEGDEAGLFGSLKLEGGNVAPLAALFGVAPRAGTIGPVAAEADVTRRGDSWNVSRISATVAGLKTTGALVYAPPPERAQALAAPDLSRAEEAVGGPAADTEPPPAAISGQLTFDRLRLADLLALSLGPPQPPRPGANWSTARFAAPPLTPPSAAVRLNAGTIGLTDGLVAQGFSTSLRLDGGRLDLDDVAMKVGGDAVSGRVTLRRSGDMATLEGAVSAEPMLLKRKGFAGRVGGRFDFASTGKSPAALIAGLAGGGEVELSGAALPQSDPAALDRVVAAAQADGAEIDETNVAYAFGAALNKGALAIPGGPAPLSLSAGTIRLGPLAFEAGQVQASLTAGFDLSSLALETQLALTEPAAGLKFWTGPPPSASVTVENALDAPTRRIEVAALSAGLATQAIGRESDRIANLEADIRERAFLNRRLKGERFLDRRDAEIEDWRAEQERLKGLDQRLASQRAEEQRLAAERAAADKAAEKAAAERPTDSAPRSSGADAQPAGDRGTTPGAEAPEPPVRPKPKPAPAAPDPAASGIY